MSENIIPFHINNSVQAINAEGLEGEFTVELNCLIGGICYLLRPDAVGGSPSAANAAASVAAGPNADFVLAASPGNPVMRKLTDSRWYVYSPGDCVGLIIANDDDVPKYS